MRQLAAIMFADMVGFTALMQENEKLAREKRVRLKEVLESCVSAHNGKILQYYGDGSLSMFNSAIDSVNCAIEIQKQLREEPKVDLRIGIHTGDISIEDDSIYGDGVNLASRIESLAVPGSIFISEKVYDDLKNQRHLSTRELGHFELKNIRQPVKIFAIVSAGLITPSREELKGKTTAPSNRLAVLPFVNMSADPENEYFSDGITEELLSALTRVEGLQVTSRTSAFAFKGKHDDIREIGTRLNVDKILEGSVRKAGNRVRITAQLINAADGYHIWSENYDRDLVDIFEVQDEISGIIANKLRENLVDAKKSSHLVKAPTKNVTAYTYYLKGLHFWNKLTPADTRKAIGCYEDAIALEPGYAHAYAMMAAAYSSLGSMGQMIPGKAFALVHEFADKAIELDPTIAEGYLAKAGAYLLYDWKWQKAYDVLSKAIELNPTHTEAYHLLAFYYIITNEKERSLDVMLEALKHDPLSQRVNHFLAEMYVFNERYDEALKYADIVLEMNPNMRSTIELKGWTLGMKNDWKGALKMFEEQHRLTNHPLKGLMGLCFAYSQLGMNDKAMECIRKMEQRQREEPDAVIDADLGAAWYGIGDLDKAFHYFNICVEKRMGPLGFFLEYPLLKDLKKDPRYWELREKEGSLVKVEKPANLN